MCSTVAGRLCPVNSWQARPDPVDPHASDLLRKPVSRTSLTGQGKRFPHLPRAFRRYQQMSALGELGSLRGKKSTGKKDNLAGYLFLAPWLPSSPSALICRSEERRVG